MAQRRIGPIQGAGVGVIELEGDKPIEAAALGWAGYAGILEKGMVGELIRAVSKSDFLRKCGSYMSDSLLPDSCLDYFDNARGAGGLCLVRVTDGNESPAEVTLHCRKKVRTTVGKLKAKNGGRWGGKDAKHTADLAVSGDLTNTTLDTKSTALWKTDRWIGGYLELSAVSGKQYPIVGSTAAGVIQVASDSTMKDDWTAAAAPTDLRYYLVLENDGKSISYEIRDGVENPASEFGLYIYVDGVLSIYWSDLNLDPANARYWVNVINNDTSNYEVEAIDSWTGAYAADVRPANYYGENTVIAEESITVKLFDFDPDYTGDGNGTAVVGTTTDAMVEQVITITFSAPTAFTAVSDKFGSLGAAGTVGTAFVPNNKWTPPFTLTAGTSAWAAADVAKLTYKPLVVDALIGGYVYPDKVNGPKTRFLIIDNTHKVITVQAGSDMTGIGMTGDEFMVVCGTEFLGGLDGIADLVDADYQNQAWDVSNSPFNRIEGRNLGLVKFSTPGIYATAVQKAGISYADAKNHQYRIEIPSTTMDETSADGYVNDTIGRSDFAVVSFPSYGYVADPQGNGQGKLKLVPMTGMIHGREARIAADYSGYHKAEAGIDATLPKILKLPTGEKILNEEYLNPLGINVIKKVKGNFVLWGDRSLWTDTNWKWKHQRELMCYYENVLKENFDWIVFQINETATEKRAITSLRGFLYPEFVKGALRGNKFEDACQIKIDSELNTDAVRAAGDMYAQIMLRFGDVVERFIIRMGRQGIFEAVG